MISEKFLYLRGCISTQEGDADELGTRNADGVDGVVREVTAFRPDQPSQSRRQPTQVDESRLGYSGVLEIKLPEAALRKDHERANRGQGVSRDSACTEGFAAGSEDFANRCDVLRPRTHFYRAPGAPAAPWWSRAQWWSEVVTPQLIELRMLRPPDRAARHVAPARAECAQAEVLLLREVTRYFCGEHVVRKP